MNHAKQIVCPDPIAAVTNAKIKDCNRGTRMVWAKYWI